VVPTWLSASGRKENVHCDRRRGKKEEGDRHDGSNELVCTAQALAEKGKAYTGYGMERGTSIGYFQKEGRGEGETRLPGDAMPGGPFFPPSWLQRVINPRERRSPWKKEDARCAR